LCLSFFDLLGGVFKLLDYLNVTLSRCEYFVMEVKTDFFSKQNIFLYTEHKTRIYRTKNIQLHCLNRIFKKIYAQKERLLRVSAAQRLKDCYGLSEALRRKTTPHELSKNN